MWQEKSGEGEREKKATRGKIASLRLGGARRPRARRRFAGRIRLSTECVICLAPTPRAHSSCSLPAHEAQDADLVRLTNRYMWGGVLRHHLVALHKARGGGASSCRPHQEHVDGSAPRTAYGNG